MSLTNIFLVVSAFILLLCFFSEPGSMLHLLTLDYAKALINLNNFISDHVNYVLYPIFWLFGTSILFIVFAKLHIYCFEDSTSEGDDPPIQRIVIALLMSAVTELIIYQLYFSDNNTRGTQTALTYKILVKPSNDAAVIVSALRSERAQIQKECVVLDANGYFAKSQQSALLIIQAEGCGGGNNLITFLTYLSDFRNHRWHRIRRYSDYYVTGLDYYNDNLFEVTTVDYDKTDPRCCPTKVKTTIFPPN
jgi:hypothetical protein